MLKIIMLHDLRLLLMKHQKIFILCFILKERM